MSSYVVLPDVTRTETTHATSTIVLCGTPDLVRQAHNPLTGNQVTLLTGAAQLRAYADRHSAPGLTRAQLEAAATRCSAGGDDLLGEPLRHLRHMFQPPPPPPVQTP